MMEKTCPNCGISVPASAAGCRCGFAFLGRGIETPGPGAVRNHDMLGQAAAPRRTGGIALDEALPPLGPRRPSRRSRRPPALDDSAPNDSLLMDCLACEARISRRAAQCPKCG